MRKQAIETLEALIRQVPLRDQASSVIHALCTVIVGEAPSPQDGLRRARPPHD